MTTPHHFRLSTTTPSRRRDGRGIHQPHQLLHRHLARVPPHGIRLLQFHLLPRERGADAQDPHAGGPRCRDARGRVLYDNAAPRVRAEGLGRGQERVGRWLEPLERVGGDDGIEIVPSGNEADGIQARVDLDRVRGRGDGGPEPGRAAGRDERPGARGRDAVAAALFFEGCQILGEEVIFQFGDVGLGDPALLGDAGEEICLSGPDKGDKLLRGDAASVFFVVGWGGGGVGARGEKERAR